MSIGPFIVAALCVACSACARQPLAYVCPQIMQGDLVVTEIAGKQSGSNSGDEQWIELYNASGRDLDLYGTRVTLTKLDGSSSADIFVRKQGIQVAAGGYAVLGNSAPGMEPSYVNYGYSGDFTSSIYSTGAVEVYACGVLADRVIYHSGLPKSGTYSLDGSKTPDANANDDPSNWCTDDQQLSPGVLGTPGKKNPSCTTP